MIAHTITPPMTERPRLTMFPTSIGIGQLPLAAALYLIAIALPTHFNIGPIYMTGARMVLLVVTVPIVIRLLTGKLGHVLPTDIFLLIYSAWSIFTLSLNSPSQAISFGGSYALEVCGSYLLARNYVRTPEQFRAVCRGLFTLLIFSIPFAVYETQTGRAPIPLFIAKIPGVYSWNDYYNLLAGRRLGLERSQVIFSHPIHYGLFCSSLFSLAVVGFKGLSSNFKRYVLGAFICMGVIASVSSGAILPMLLQVGLMLWAWIFRQVSARWIILCALIAVCYVVVDIISNRSPITVFLSYATMSPHNAYGRIYIFEWGMNNVWKNPFFGIGLNDWERPAWKSGSMDNFWLLTTVRYGIPGFLLLAAAYAGLVWAVMRRNFGDGGPIWQFRRGWVFMQIGMILTLCTVDVWATAMSYSFFLLGTGAWFLHVQPSPPPEDGMVDQEKVAPARAAIRYTRFDGIRTRKGIAVAGSGQAE